MVPPADVGSGWLPLCCLARLLVQDLPALEEFVAHLTGQEDKPALAGVPTPGKMEFRGCLLHAWSPSNRGKMGQCVHSCYVWI